MKTILITGGTGGLGTAVVKRLKRDYRCVVLYHGRKPDDVEGLQADISNEDEVNRAVSSIGELYAVVHLVGGFAMGNDAATWSKMIALNLTSAVNVIRAASPKIVNGGRIVAISSIASIDLPVGMPAYVATKGALNTVVEVFSRELKPRAITVNALLPGTLATPANQSGAMGAPSASLRAGALQIDVVASVIAFLLSDEAANISGALLPMRP